MTRRLIWCLLAALIACDAETAREPDAPVEDAAPDLADSPELADSPDLTAPAEDAAPDLAPDMEAPPDMALDMAPPAEWLGHCGEVDRFGPVFAGTVAEWTRQDALNPAWPDPVVFVGSSSIRRWDGLARAYSLYNPVQRGFGGAQLGEVAYYADELILRHKPRAVVVFAGTNDVAGGVASGVVVERFRCLRERIGAGLGWSTPVVFIGITPSPSRWDSWPESRAVNEAVQALAAADPALHYADVPTAFLSTGEPPVESLFVEDRLHLSLSGYALWHAVIGPVVAQATRKAAPPVPAPLAAGAKILIDLGPSNAEDGAPTTTDARGLRWNSWYPIDGDAQVSPGERLSGLVTTTGAATGVELVIAGGFACNGLLHGGLTTPGAALGDLAVASATQDFFYSDGVDLPGGVYLTGLDPARRYTVRLFGARRSDERRVTTYVVAGAGSQAASLQTSGAGAGQGGATLNDARVAEVVEVAPDAAGHLFIDVQRTEGSYAYLSALEIVAR
jgi:hypothetical protein